MDATRVVYRVLDKAGNILPYINESIEFEVSGPGEVIGPKVTALIGGCIAVWIRTTGEKGYIKLKASINTLEAKEIVLKVI